MRIAVVIPTLNEAVRLGATLDALAKEPADAVVVADCGSTDRTVAIARARGVDVVTGPEIDSRAAAMQAGFTWLVSRADPGPTRGFDAVWFLHADTPAPEGWRGAIGAVLAEPGTVGGAMTPRFWGEGAGWVQRRLLRFVIFCNRCRYGLSGVYLGDQGLFVRPAALLELGGVPQVPLMEDVELCVGLKRLGRVGRSPLKLSTSPRRFLKHGVLRQLLQDSLLLSVHRLGFRPQRLYAGYNRDNADQPAEAAPASAKGVPERV
ncbi:MAG: glycosyltransferase [Planctomycetota bacterium]